MSAAWSLGVLVSGEGKNLQALIDQLHGTAAEIVAVASNRAAARALARARVAGIDAAAFELRDYPDRAARDAAMAEFLALRGVRLVVCAGYMQLLTPAFLERFACVNVHPSLLPAFPGTHAIEDALAAGVRETGVTVHLVDDGVDTGPILAQARVPVHYDDDAEALRERVHAVEHRLLPETVRGIIEGRYELAAGGRE